MPTQEPPRFDWREFKANAREIVAEVGRDIRVVSIRGDRARKGEKLATNDGDKKSIVEGLARMLAQAAEDYEDAKAYSEVMDIPVKRERPSVAKKPSKVPMRYDYSAHQSIEETH